MKKKIAIFTFLISTVLVGSVSADCEAIFNHCWDRQPHDWGLGEDGEDWRAYYQGCAINYELCVGATE
ncbi:MAG: hypothetical protein JJ892_14970 [Balneola sp.]|nr:hypothetical protein [Balneola sp.]